MSEQNPYIVREEDGKAATIRDFVTGVPLKPEEMLPDEHGIHPVSPLGFINKDDGTALGVHAATTGSIMYDDGVTYEEASQLAYVVEGKYGVYTGNAIAFPVMYLERNANNTFTVKVDGLVPTREMQKFYFRNATSDDYGPTGLVDDNYVVSASSFTDDGVDSTIVLPAGTASFAGIVGAGKLLLCVQPVQGTIGELKKYLLVQNGDSVEHTGIFKPGSGPGAPFLKMYDGDYGNPAASTGSFDLLIAYNTAAWNYIDVKLGNGTWYKLENETYGGQTVPPDHRPDNHIFYSNGGNTNCTVIHIDNAELDNGFPIFRTWCWNSNQNYGPYQSTEEGVADTPAAYTAQTSVPSFVTIGCINNSIAAANLGGTVYYQRMNDAWSCAGKSPADPPDDFYFWIFNIKQVDKSCYASNGYSDREVADWVRGKMEPVIGYGKHPSAMEGNLEGAGAFTRWFASCGNVEISGGAGSKQVTVPGFGLGAGYTGYCPKLTSGDTGSGQAVSGGWLTFGYGTKYSDLYAAGVPALPLDWPFTGKTEVPTGVDATDLENSITLVKDGVLIPDEGEDTYTRYGSLTKDDGTVMNRIHVCLYNDLAKNGSEHGGLNGTTELKKTFVNLGTPLTTGDGDEYEITVSLPIVNSDDVYNSSDPMKSQSAYYAYISQPRVYVVSGTWKFSDTRVIVESSVVEDDVQTITVSDTFKDSAGNAITDCRVRVELIPVAYGYDRVTCIGTLDGASIVLDEGDRADVNLDRTEYTICGAAYLDDNNATFPEGSTPIGLNAVRDPDAVGSKEAIETANGEYAVDYGGNTELQVYNRMYGADDDEQRQHLITNSDKRQIVATVYPTVTNTFAWELAGRKKLSSMETLMTMDADTGNESLMARIAWMNRKIIKDNFDGLYAPLSPAEYPIDIDSTVEPGVGGLSDYSYIASILQVAPYSPDEDGSVPEETQPVRQAIRAARMLAADYRNARVRTKRPTVNASNVFVTETSPVNSGWSGMFSGSTHAVDAGTLAVDAQIVRLRNLPPVVTQVMSGDDNTPVSPILDLHPYVWVDGQGNKRVSHLHTDNAAPYGYGEYSSTDATTETACDFVNNLEGKQYSDNSVAMAYMASSPSWLDTVDKCNDLIRAVELAAIELGNDPAVRRPFTMVGNDISPDWLEPYDSFTKIVSPDNIPVPAGFSDSLYSGLSDSPKAKWFGGDAYAYYRILKQQDDTSAIPMFIASTMSPAGTRLTELTEFLMNYIPSYGAGLAQRNWDSYRVKVPVSSFDTTDPVYLSRMAWYGTECSNEFRGKYVGDAFLRGLSFEDVNLNRVNVPGYVSSYSSTPYALGGNFDPSADAFPPFSTSNADGQESVGYVRVIMKFTFSADAGRWYCTGYRQAPVAYLTPLYGARALEETLDGQRIWVTSECSRMTWKGATRKLYSEYRPLDINPALVDSVMQKDDNGYSRLMRPYLGITDGGIGLNPPRDKNGDEGTVPAKEAHANFWSVRSHLRPAAGALAGTDIPRYHVEDSSWVHSETGGIMSDPVLWGQYDYPAKRTVEYHLPSPDDPSEEIS